MGNPSSPTLSSNCENRRACFCQTSPGMHVWGVLIPIRTFMRSNWPRRWNRGKTFACVPYAMVVKVKDAETKRNKASVAYTGWNKRKKKNQYDNTKKRVRLYSSSLQLLFNRKFANQRAIVQQESQIHRVTGPVVEGKRIDEMLSYSP